MILPFFAISFAPKRVSRAKERESESSGDNEDEISLSSLIFSITLFTPSSERDANGEERKEASDSRSS